MLTFYRQGLYMKPLREQADKVGGAGDAVRPEEERSDAPVPHESQTLDYDYSNFFWGSGDDAFGILELFQEWIDEAKPAGYYLFGQPMCTAPVIRFLEAYDQ